MIPLLAQLVAPPLQPGPVRLPEPDSFEQRPAPGRPPAAPIEVEPQDVQPEPESPVPATEPDGEATAPSLPAGRRRPEVRGLTVYSPDEVRRILGDCPAVEDPAERLRVCAGRLGQRLAADGYVSTRVYVRESPAPGVLDVVEGRIVELRVEGGRPWFTRRVEKLMLPVRGEVLRLPRLQRDLQLLSRVSGAGAVQARLTRLGSDPSQAVLTLTLPGGGQRWQGDLTSRNDGNDGSGEFRSTASLLKPSLLRGGDTLLLYGELNRTDAWEVGTAIGSISYSYPLADSLFLTGAFGYTRRNLVELDEPLDGFSTSQYQALGQLEWVFHESLRQRWSLFAGYSHNRTNAYLDNIVLPEIFPETVRRPTTGYVRLGVNGRVFGDRTTWAGTGYLLQGIAAATPSTQRKELASAGIEPGEATALGGLLSGAWAFAPGWQLNLRTGGQVGLRSLTNPMRFVLGSDVGLRGLPAQLLNGDDGWLGTGEVAWTFWRNRRHALQLVPFVGVGWVRTEFPQATFSDTIGAGGVLARWLQGDFWEMELGWVDQFGEKDNPGTWNDWILADGLYWRVSYRF